MSSTAFHPQSLGSLERAHRVFVDYLKHYCTKTDWDDWIRFGIFSYNTSVHEATGFTPHELVFGVKAIIPTEFARQEVPRTFIEYLDQLFMKLTTTQATAAVNYYKMLRYNYHSSTRASCGTMGGPSSSFTAGLAREEEG